MRTELTATAGQALVELDADEPEAEVRAQEATVRELSSCLARLKAMPRAEERAEARAELESAKIAHAAAIEYQERLVELRQHNVVSERQLIEQKTSRLRAEADERSAAAKLEQLLKQPIVHEIAEAEARLAAAQAELEALRAELEHYVVHAPIDGIVSWLEVAPGTVTRPGTRTWGEIIDLNVMHVRAEVTPEIADRLRKGAVVEIASSSPSNERFAGVIVFVAPTVD